jgi:hypothetical protein
LNESNALSHDLLTHRYESLPVCFLQNEALVPNVKTSLWWRDVMMIGGVSDACLFSHNVNNILGDGFTTCFLKEIWLGLDPLEVAFLSLFAKTTP